MSAFPYHHVGRRANAICQFWQAKPLGNELGIFSRSFGEQSQPGF